MHNTITSFADFQFAPAIESALEGLQFQTPTPIQAQTIPFLLAGQDVLGLAQTGTGKTAAFVLPLLQQLVNAKKSRLPQALIITPTRELAIQVEQHIKDLTSTFLRLETVVLCGGQSYLPQLRQLKKGAPIVVGTPGRIIDHLRQNNLDLSELKYFVLDEADEMLRMGFVEDVEAILEHTPEKRQMALFSATMPPRIRQLVSRYLNQPEVVEIKPETHLMPKIEQRFLFASPSQKSEALLKLLAIAEPGAKIVFVRTKQQTEQIAEALMQSGLRAIALNGDLAQAMRERLIQQFRRGSVDVLVATDIAARGLDVSQVTMVINYDIPGDPETYVHRIGRTGRAGRSGQSILFVEPKQTRLLNIIERHTKQKIQKMQVPSDAYIQVLQQQQFLQGLTQDLAQKAEKNFRAPLEALLQEQGHDWADLAMVLVKRALKTENWVSNADSPYVVSSEDDAPRFERSNKFSQRVKSKPQFSKSREQVLYRLAVGRKHGVKPGQIIGALANEGGISGAEINGLKIYDNYATVFLPGHLSKRALDNIKNAWVCGRQLLLKTQSDMV